MEIHADGANHEISARGSHDNLPHFDVPSFPPSLKMAASLQTMSPSLCPTPSVYGFLIPMDSISCSSEGMGGGDDEVLHVLAVDDSVIERKFIERLLKNSAYKVTTAENGFRALEYLGLLGETRQSTLKTNDLKVNLIITDYCMPEMTGYELMKKIKESSFLKEIPVVIMSSENIPTRIEKCLEEGAEEFMLKPLRQSDVKRLRCHITKVHHPSNEILCLGS